MAVPSRICARDQGGPVVNIADEALRCEYLSAVHDLQVAVRASGPTDKKVVGRPRRIGSRHGCGTGIRRGTDYRIMGRQLCAVAHGQLRSGARPDVYNGRHTSQPRRSARQLHATVGNSDPTGRGAGSRQTQHAGADVVQRAGAADVAGVVDGVASVENDRRVVDDIAAD
ncbi:hypothetical protein D3C71_1655380 [compost metagenome]